MVPNLTNVSDIHERDDARPESQHLDLQHRREPAWTRRPAAEIGPTNVTAGTDLAPQYVLIWRTLYKFNGRLFPSHLAYFEPQLQSPFIPHEQRSTIVLTISLPHSMDIDDNNSRVPIYSLLVSTPAKHICASNYDVSEGK
jgi:hypothetical protein